MKWCVFFLLLNFFKTPCLQAQDAVNKDTVEVLYCSAFPQTSFLQKSKPFAVTALHGAMFTGSFVLLNQAWYKNYNRQKFHLFNDSKEWLQIDKAGHVWSTYSVAKLSAQSWQWAGYGKNKAALYGSVSAMLFQTIIELQDAYSAKWGWSWADMGANTLGAASFYAQQTAWGFQKVQIKFSAFPKKPAPGLQPRANDLFGKSLGEKILKDYNHQKYWASFSARYTGWKSAPQWLQLSVGYSANGMYGGFKNIAYDDAGNTIFDRRDIPRRRHFYLAPDVDWTKIKTSKKSLRTAFYLLNFIKCPAPALSFSHKKLRLHGMAF